MAEKQACTRCIKLTRERDRLRTMVDKADRILRAAAPPGLHAASWDEIGRGLIALYHRGKEVAP